MTYEISRNTAVLKRRSLIVCWIGSSCRWNLRVLTLCFFSLAALAQNSSSSQSSVAPIRDPQAVAIIQNALAALGGEDTHIQVRTAVIHGNIERPEGQTSSSFLW